MQLHEDVGECVSITDRALNYGLSIEYRKDTQCWLNDTRAAQGE